MGSSVPLWSVPLLGVFVVAAAAASSAFDAVLAARASGQATLPAAAAPLRDAARLLVQQRRRTHAQDAVLFRMGIVTLPVIAVMASLPLPLGGRSVADLSIGIVWFNALEVMAWAAVWLVGWGANSPFALIGGYRFVVQGLAYELPHMFAIITAGLGAGSLRVGAVVSEQSGLWLVVWMPVAFLVYLLSAFALAFASPFDHPLGRDAADGAAVELTGVDRLVFFAGRWLLLVVAVAFAVPLFLGGGNGPLLPAWLWMLVKTALLLAVVLWVRRRLPAMRMERYTELAWVVLIPLAIVQALAVALVVLERR